MNIFYLDEDVTLCAQSHVDRHVSKMLIEYAQLLSTAHRVISGTSAPRACYKLTHKNHPSAVWTRECSGNYLYLYNLWTELHKEFMFRYGKGHMSYLSLFDVLRKPPKRIPVAEFYAPPMCVPDEYKYLSEDTVEVYRQYYKQDKSHLHSWKDRNVPSWILK